MSKKLIYLDDALSVMPALEMCSRALKSLETVDARPVIHGYWIEEYTNIRCSVCGATYSDEIEFMNRNFKYESLPYCPNCGAQMDSR